MGFVTPSPADSSSIDWNDPPKTWLAPGGTPTPTPPPISDVDALGWKGTGTGVDLSLAPIAVSRPGFTTAGATTAYVDTVLLTKRVRQVYPNQASFAANDQAFSDAILAQDTVVGLPSHHSLLVSPQPIINWAMLDRQLVGNSLTLETTGNHWFARNGNPYACVIYSVTDGTTTLTGIATAMAVSGHPFDVFAVCTYSATIDITSLNTGFITANAVGVPWVGGTASKIDSSTTGGGRREFSPRYFYKDAARFANPPMACVKSTGNDTTGVVGNVNSPTAPRAAPFATIKGAWAGLVAATGITGGILDGCQVWIQDTVGFGTNVSNFPQKCAAVTMTRDPGVAQSVAIVSMPATVRPRMGVGTLLSPLTEGCIQFSDVSLVRSGATTWQGEAATQLCVMYTGGMSLDCGSTSATFCNNSHMYFDGASVLSASSSSALTASAAGQIRMVRGVTTDRNGGGLENWLVLGSRFDRCGGNGSLAGSNGSIQQFNGYFKSSAQLIDIANGGNVSQYSFSQCLIEWIGSVASTPGIRISGDSGLGSLNHVLVDNITIATGHYQAGRVNGFYDETVGTVRTHVFSRMHNVLIGNWYIKEDVFVALDGNGSPNPGDAPNHFGNFWNLHACGCRNIWTQLIDPSSNNVGNIQGPAYAGVGSHLGTSNNVPQASFASLFSNPQMTTNTGVSPFNPVAGAGGGAYDIVNGAAVIGLVPAFDEVFPFDLAGNARNRGTLGAYR